MVPRLLKRKRNLSKLVVIFIHCHICFWGYTIIDQRYGENSAYCQKGASNFCLARIQSQNIHGHKDSSGPEWDIERYSAKEKMIKIFGTEDVIEKPISDELDVDEIERLLTSFFTYLDNRPYIKFYNFSTGTQEQFGQIYKRLNTDLPIVAGETQSLHYLVKNVFYFYRTLGKNRVDFLRDVLKWESNILEPLMHTFYLWSTNAQHLPNLALPIPSLEHLYEYACFFLETLGGRNYLFRRDPKVRVIAKFYCILIIERANSEDLNPNGIDIRPHLQLTYEEIKNQEGLNYRNAYLSELKELRKRYKLI